MLETLFGWVIISIIVPLLVGAGLSVMSTSPPEFRAARWCFTAAFLILALKFGLWLTVEQTEGLSLIGALSIIVLYLCIGAFWLRTMDWVDTRQITFDENKNRRLCLEFLDNLFDYSNPNVFDVVVSVRNPTESTILGVAVYIESIRNLDAPDDSDVARLLPIFRNLSLALRDDHTTPPRREVDIHPHSSVIFKLVTLQRDIPQQKQHGEILLHHTQWQVEKNTPRFDSPYQRPSGALPLGRYRVQLRAQGQDVPPELLSIEFENVPGRAKAWVV